MPLVPRVRKRPVESHLAGVEAGRSLRLRVEPDGREIVSLPEIAVMAGYTGRERDAVLDHIRELEEIGVASPPEVPMFYPVSPQLITQDNALLTTEAATSGEAEVGLVVHDGDVYVTVGSDHTDRAAERLDIAVSKRACHKVIARSAWRLDDVAGHWDALRLRSWIGENAESLYQDGPLSSLMAPLALLEAIPWRARPRRFLVLCGTVPTIGGVHHSSHFRAELHDPVTERRLRLDYEIRLLDFVQPMSADDPSLDPDSLERIAQSADALGVQLSGLQASYLASRLGDVERRLQP